MQLLENVVKNYLWGSMDEIPQFLRSAPEGQPIAEVWMGTHPLGTSRTESGRLLTEFVSELPFMLKILSASRPLSLQVHPVLESAKLGFAAEEAAGVPLDASHRVYKDPNHKPEMVYALTTFDTMVGFRPTAEILRLLGAIESPLAESLAEDLRINPGFAGIVKLVDRILSDPVTPGDIHQIVVSCRGLIAQGIDVKRAYATALEVAEFYPTDPGVIISLLLNRLTLQPGEAAYLAPGIIHAHLRGLALETMASSDNVIRAGLTDKHVDKAGLVQTLNEGMSRLARVEPRHVGDAAVVFSPAVDEFALAVVQVSKADPEGVVMPALGHRLMVCTGGDVRVANASGEDLKLARGDSLYAGPDDQALTIFGTGEVAEVFCPDPDAPNASLIDLV